MLMIGYLASYLIIKQLRSGHKIEEETVDDGDTIESFHSKDDFEDPIRTTHHQSINATIVATPSSPNFKLDKIDFTESNSDTNGTVIESSEKRKSITSFYSSLIF
jgi:hypothetical protein